MFKVNFVTFCISKQCPNHHDIKSLSYENFENNYIKPINSDKYNCSKCFQTLNDRENIYKCQNYKKLFFRKCR